MEIGCGSGALSLVAARFGCVVTACDVNPLSVACTRAHFKRYGLEAAVFEGGPGPVEDGGAGQWGGLDTYDVVVWNTPYLGVNALEDGTLGPMEEAALTDTDAVGLYARFIKLLANGELLTPEGVAYLTVSSKGEAKRPVRPPGPLALLHGVWPIQCLRTVKCFPSSRCGIHTRMPPFSIWRKSTAPTPNSYAEEGLAAQPCAPMCSMMGGAARPNVDFVLRCLTRIMVAFLGSDLSHATMDQLRVGVSLGRSFARFPMRVRTTWR